MLVLAFVIPVSVNALIEQQLSIELMLDSKKSDSYDGWQTNANDPDAPEFHYDIYIFDYVNANEVVCNVGSQGPYGPRDGGCPDGGGQAPEIVERGPFAYRKYWQRFDVEWSDHGNKLSFVEQDWYMWDEERAGPGLSEHDVLTQPSLAANLVESMLKEYSALVPTSSSSSAGAERDLSLAADRGEGEEQMAAKKGRIVGGVTFEKERLLTIHQGVEMVASALRRTQTPAAAAGEEVEARNEAIEAAARAVETLGGAVARSFDAANSYGRVSSDGSSSGDDDSSSSPGIAAFGGDGWRLLLKFILCAAPPDGDSPFHSRSAHDLYWGYWGDPLLNLLRTVIQLTGGEFTTYLPGFSTNYTTEDSARRLQPGPTIIHTGKDDISKLHQLQRYQNMANIYVCLAADQSTGDEENQVPAVCPDYDPSWTQSEALANGYVAPWEDPKHVPVDGYNDGENFEPFHAAMAPGEKVPPDWRREIRKMYISDIYRSVGVKHATTNEWRGISLSRLTLQDKDLHTANCSWAWPQDEKHCNPDNADYDAFGPAGLLNMTTLSGGAKLFASKPHFLDGHPTLVENFEGALHPDPAIHDTYIDIEPVTGAPFRLAERLQLNLQLENWDLPALPLYEYFGWDPAQEKEVVVQGLEKAWVAVRDAAVDAVAKVVEEKVQEKCDEQSVAHLEHCKETASKLKMVLYAGAKKYCRQFSSAPVFSPTPLPSGTPSALPSAIPELDLEEAPKVFGVGSSHRSRRDLLALPPSIAPPPIPYPHPSDGEEVCADLESLWESTFSQDKVVDTLLMLQAQCQASPATCEGVKESLREQVEEWVESTCNGDDVDDQTKELCALGKEIAEGLQTAWTAVLGFCEGSLCDLAAFLVDHVPSDWGSNRSHFHGGVVNATCAARKKKRREHCAAVAALKDAVTHKYCNSSKVVFDQSRPLKEDIVVTEADVCALVHQELFENTFDDDRSPAWTGWKTPDEWPHGILFWKADEFCSKNFLQETECATAQTEVLQEIANYCDDPKDRKTEGACKAARFVTDNLEAIDAKLALWPEFCEDGFTDICDKGSFGEKVMGFCNTSSLDGFEALLKGDDDDFGTYGHLGVALAEQCPTIVDAVSAAVQGYCGDPKKPAHAFECAVVKSIPWGQVPFSSDGGPVLAWIEDTVVPEVQNLTAKLSAWCFGTQGEGGEVPAWHGDACEALGSFLSEELERAFELAVEAVDALLPNVTLAPLVAEAEDWLQCSLGTSRWEGIPEPFGYMMPLSWADEWLELPKSLTDEYTEDIQDTQVAAATAKLWCLILAALAGVCAGVLLCGRQLVKADYEAEERLLGRDLVLGKGHSFGNLEDYNLLSGDGNGGDGGGGGEVTGVESGNRSASFSIGSDPNGSFNGGNADGQRGANEQGAGPFSSAWV